MTASRWLSALKKYTIKLVQERSMPKLYFPLLFLFWSASFHLASANNHEASLCRVSHFSKYQPTGRGTRELDLPDGGGSCTQITKQWLVWLPSTERKRAGGARPSAPGAVSGQVRAGQCCPGPLPRHGGVPCRARKGLGAKFKDKTPVGGTGRELCCFSGKASACLRKCVTDTGGLRSLLPEGLHGMYKGVLGQ